MNDKTSVYESIDRLVTTEIRLYAKRRGLYPNYMSVFAKDGNPITEDIAKAILKTFQTAKLVLESSQVVMFPKKMPNGENDGPYGAAILGRALEVTGRNCHNLD